MAKATDFNIVKAPDGYYFGRILKSGMLSNDSRRITEQEIIAMFEDVLRRNKAETGRSVMTVFSKRTPVLMAKIDPDIRETGVLPVRRVAVPQQQKPQARNAKAISLRVGDFGEPQK